MTEKQYWHREPELIRVYYKAYMQRVHQEAHLYGYYSFVAYSTALRNALISLDGKPHKPLQYMQKPLVVADDYFKKTITKENVDTEYRKGLKYQMNWVNSLSNNK